MTKISRILVPVLALALGAATAQSQQRAGCMMGTGSGMRQQRRAMTETPCGRAGMGMGGGMRRMGADSAMTEMPCGRAGMGLGPGMRGMGADSATAAQMRVIHELVVNHDQITRTVTHIPNGIRTVTESDDPRLAQLVRDHVLAMDSRVQEGKDMRHPMESAALRAIFRAGDRIHTATQATDKGIVLLQWSSDSAAVTSLRQHAAEVTDLVERGRIAMHEARMRQRSRP